MPLSLTEVQTALDRDSVREVVLELLTDLEFPVEAWQEEAAARSIVEVGAALGAEMSKPVAALAKMVFTSTAEGEFLDAKMQSDFDEARVGAIAATFNVSLENSGGINHTPAIGQVILRSANGQTFTNTEAVPVPGGVATPMAFKADEPGAAGNITAQDLELTTPLAGVVAVFDGTFTTVGADAESDEIYRERGATKWATLRAESIDAALISRIREAVPAIFSIGFDRDNPRGPGTTDVYLAGENATAGGGDVAAAQVVLDAHTFGNGSVSKLVKAIAAPTLALPVAATVYVSGITSEDAVVALNAAWTAFLATVPIGGFDLSPGPENVIQLDQIVDALRFTGRRALTLTAPTAAVSVPVNTKVLESTVAWTIVQVT